MTTWKKFRLADANGYVFLSSAFVQEVTILGNAICIITQNANVYDVKDISIQELENWLNGYTTSDMNNDDSDISLVMPGDIEPDPACTPDNPKYAEAFATLDCSDVLR